MRCAIAKQSRNESIYEQHTLAWRGAVCVWVYIDDEQQCTNIEWKLWQLINLQWEKEVKNSFHLVCCLTRLRWQKMELKMENFLFSTEGRDTGAFLPFLF